MALWDRLSAPSPRVRTLRARTLRAFRCDPSRGEATKYAGRFAFQAAGQRLPIAVLIESSCYRQGKKTGYFFFKLGIPTFKTFDAGGKRRLEVRNANISVAKLVLQQREVNFCTLKIQPIKVPNIPAFPSSRCGSLTLTGNEYFSTKEATSVDPSSWRRARLKFRPPVKSRSSLNRGEPKQARRQVPPQIHDTPPNRSGPGSDRSDACPSGPRLVWRATAGIAGRRPAPRQDRPPSFWCARTRWCQRIHSVSSSFYPNSLWKPTGAVSGR